MTNSSVKNLLFGISVFTVVAMLSLGAFATTVRADSFSDFGDFGGGYSDFGGYDNYSDFGSYDAGYSDYGGYDNYSDFGSYNGGYDVAAPDSGYDVAAPDNGYDVAAPDYGYDVSAPDYGYDVAASDNGYDVAAPDYGYDSYDSYESDNGYSYSDSSYASQVFHSTPMTIAPPSYPSYPSYPVYPQPQPRPTPVQPIQNTTTNTNTCLNNSCNTSYTDNSINGSFNTAPVYSVTPQPIIQYVQPIAAPYCSITIGQGYQNGMVNLSWTSTGATFASISPSVGTVNVNGSTNLYAYGNTVYTLTVTGQGGTYTCRTQSYVAPAAPTSPYVSLSQIPYTGFDFGPVGNAFYWLALLSFAVAGAYLVVYYQGGALALAGNVFGRTVSYSETTTETTPAHTEAEVAHEVAHEAPVALFNLPTQAHASTKDSMTVAHTTDGVPRIIITRN